MNKFVNNIEKLTIENNYFRNVIITTSNQQLVVMSLNPNEDIGEEVHNNVDQFIKIEEGEGYAILNGEKTNFGPGFSINIPKGVTHNIVNSSSQEKLKLYTIYSPPEHKEETIHKTKAEALEDSTHF
jgi:mannose-6-phosphate isomerase-like protein (cupin superfamily)